MTTRLLSLLIFAALAACGDNITPTAPDAGGPTTAAPPAAPRAIVVAGDFTPGDPGVLTTLDPATLTVKTNTGPAMAVGDDPILRHIGSELFIINRSDGNNVTILDDQTLAFKEQLGTGAGSNPYDVAVVGQKLYVATYGTKGVTVLTRGSTTTKVIDLSADDPDGLPNCNSVFLVDTRLFVSCELLDNTMTFLPPRGPGKIYVVDTTTDTLLANLTITMVKNNPFTWFEQIPAGALRAGDLLIGSVDFNTNDGCIERITTGPTPGTDGCIADNTTLGGYATRIDFQIDTATNLETMWMAVSSFDFVHAGVRSYDLLHDRLADFPTPTTETIADVAFCPSGQLVAIDSTKNANGLRVFVDSIERTTAALPIGLGLFSQHGLACY